MASASESLNVRNRSLQGLQEFWIKGLLWLSAGFSIAITVVIIVILFGEAIRFFADDSITFAEFFGSTKWTPTVGTTAESKSFGVWPLVCGTLVVTVIAIGIALPLGIVTAIFLSEYAPRKVRAFLKPALEILAGVPTVVYGFFALTFITPQLNWVHQLFFGEEGFAAFNSGAAGIAVGILCLPIITSLTEDALRAVPRSLREAAYGLGSTRFEVATRVVVPAALSGIVSAALLAIARTIGETMIVALAAGSTPNLTVDPRDGVQTMTGFMVQIAGGDFSNFGIEYLSMYAVAAVLFAMTFGLTLLGHRIRVRFREAY